MPGTKQKCLRRLLRCPVSVATVTAAEIRAGCLQAADVLVVPGGSSCADAKALAEAGLELVRASAPLGCYTLPF